MKAAFFCLWFGTNVLGISAEAHHCRAVEGLNQSQRSARPSKLLPWPIYHKAVDISSPRRAPIIKGLVHHQ